MHSYNLNNLTICKTNKKHNIVKLYNSKHSCIINVIVSVDLH